MFKHVDEVNVIYKKKIETFNTIQMFKLYIIND